MDLRSFWRMTALSVCILQTPLAMGLSFQGNAVAGSVQVKIKGSDQYVPLEGVTVTVVQNTSISNQTRSGDGVYVLLVTDSHRTFDLLYTKPRYCSAKRANISNGDKQKKIDIVTMIPEAEVSSLSDNEKTKLFNDSLEIIRLSEEVNLSTTDKVGIRAAGIRNVQVLDASISPTKPGVQMARPNPVLKQKIDLVLKTNVATE